MYILVEVIEREISMPNIFPTYDEAFDKMCEYVAESCGVTKGKVIQMYTDGVFDDGGEVGVYSDSAWAERFGENYDWKIFNVPSADKKRKRKI